MIPELLLYTTLSCQDTQEIMQRIKLNDSLDNVIKVELVQTLKDSAPECDWYWDAND